MPFFHKVWSCKTTKPTDLVSILIKALAVTTINAFNYDEMVSKINFAFVTSDMI